VTIEKVDINPYVLSGAVRGLVIRDKDGEPFISWKEAYANFQLLSFFGKPWVFKEILVTDPFARIQINKDRSLNFDDLIKKLAAAPPEPAKKSKPLYLLISRIEITGASASYADLTPKTPFRRRLGPLTVTLTDLHTEPNKKDPFSLSGSTDSGEKFSWTGYFSVEPLLSEGQLSLAGLALSKYAPLYQDMVRFEIKEGSVDFASTYRVGVSGSTNYIAEISHGAFTLKSLKVAEQNSDHDVAELDKLAVNDIDADLVKRTAKIASILAEGGRLDARRNHEGKINLVEVSRPAESATNAPQSAMLAWQGITNILGLLLQTTNAVSAVLHQLDVTNCAVSWEDSATARPVNLRLDNIAVTGRDLSNLPGSNMTAAVSLNWNTNGAIRTETTAALSPPAADVSLALTNIELAPLGPYVEQFANVLLVDSKLTLDSQMQLKMTNDVPDATLKADVRWADFATLDSLMKADLVKWKLVHVSGLNATANPRQMTIKEIDLVDPLARVAIESNCVINVLAVLKKTGDTNAPAQTTNATPPASPAKDKPAVEPEVSRLAKGTNAPGTNAAGPSLLPPIMVDRIVITNATMEFADQSVQPPVKASVRALNGTISHLSSKESERADLQFEGKVDGTGPVTIVGKLEPLRPKAATELTLALHDMNLKPASPYVGKYAGYRLMRGSLNYDMGGGVTDNKVSATNHIVLDQFTFGDKVDSPDATHLPVRLGVAMLKDASGKITLDVPVQGSLDDPKFGVGSVIAENLGNLVTKLTTSPFAALGAVFGGGGEELSFQEFAPGSAELQPSGTKKLQSLVKGLNERPGLAVEIEGSVDPKTDGERLPQPQGTTPASPTDLEAAKALAVQAVAELAMSARQSANAVSSSAGRPPDSGQGRGNAVAAPVTGSGGPSAGTAQKPALVSDSADAGLRQLARQRAERVKKYLLEVGKVDSERVFLTEDSDAKVTEKGCRAYIHLR
jgi:hypothetical protein